MWIAEKRIAATTKRLNLSSLPISQAFTVPSKSHAPGCHIPPHTLIIPGAILVLALNMHEIYAADS